MCNYELSWLIVHNSLKKITYMYSFSLEIGSKFVEVNTSEKCSAEMEFCKINP
jgi:hypothetical protein